MVLAINSMANAVERQKGWPYFSKVTFFSSAGFIMQTSREGATIQVVSICAVANDLTCHIEYVKLHIIHAHAYTYTHINLGTSVVNSL